MAGWWFEPTPLKNDEVSNSWDRYPIYEMENQIHLGKLSYFTNLNCWPIWG